MTMLRMISNSVAALLLVATQVAAGPRLRGNRLHNIKLEENHANEIDSSKEERRLTLLQDLCLIFPSNPNCDQFLSTTASPTATTTEIAGLPTTEATVPGGLSQAYCESFPAVCENYCQNEGAGTELCNLLFPSTTTTAVPTTTTEIAGLPTTTATFPAGTSFACTNDPTNVFDISDDDSSPETFTVDLGQGAILGGPGGLFLLVENPDFAGNIEAVRVTANSVPYDLTFDSTGLARLVLPSPFEQNVIVQLTASGPWSMSFGCNGAGIGFP